MDCWTAGLLVGGLVGWWGVWIAKEFGLMGSLDWWGVWTDGEFGLLGSLD